LLRIVAGFEQPDEGTVRIGGADMTDVPPQRRPTAMVFQSYALFPTMTVGGNVGYGLRVRNRSRREVETRTREALVRVNLAGFEDRSVAQLSGGQQQRVALARALAVEPRVLLFDEPLSNLDVALREQTRAELKELQSALGATSLYVTHDQEEALALSDRIAIMRDGRLVQVGPPEILYQEPETAFVARFLGGSNIVVADRQASLLSGGPAPAPGVVAAVRPEDLQPVDDGGLEGRIVSRQFLGTTVEYAIEAEGLRLRMWADPAKSIPNGGLRLAARQVRWVKNDL
jgi:ABC-type Fe3+/spermidine/putrescine transport system ATPase subunit